MSGKLIKHINSKVNIVIIIVFSIMFGVSYLIWYERQLREKETTKESYARDNSITERLSRDRLSRERLSLDRLSLERLSREKGLLTPRQKDQIIQDSSRNARENLKDSLKDSTGKAGETPNPESFTMIDESAIYNEYNDKDSTDDTESIEDLVYNTPDEVYSEFSPYNERVLTPQGNLSSGITTYQNYSMVDKSLPGSWGDQGSQMYKYS
jgi:hypothetical protein